MIKNFDPELEAAIYACAGLKVLSSATVTGGDIATAFRLETDEGTIFMKALQGVDAKAMLTCEMEGLKWLGECPSVNIPTIYELVETSNSVALLMPFVLPGPRKDHDSFGQSLAEMHQLESQQSGWHKDNYIGSLAQSNLHSDSWPDFWRTQRLQPQVHLIKSSNVLANTTITRLVALIDDLENHLPPRAAHRLHGDLWNGNVMWNENGEPVLIDPAVYAGHREVDLAMMMLFGGFPKEVYESYNFHYPLEGGWQRRMPIYQLYYALVHVNLFGASYESMVLRLLDQI